jgi:toxin HigB-1
MAGWSPPSTSGETLDPAANRLEALSGDRARKHSIRINEPWRLCFVWRDGDAFDVEIVDDH